MKHFLLTLGALLALGFQQPASYAMNQAEYYIDYASPACGNFTHRSPAAGEENGLSLVMEFFDFEVSTSPSQKEVSRRCDLDVYVKVPAGMSFRLHKAVADGEYQFSPSGSIEVALDYRYSFNQEADPSGGLGVGGWISRSASEGSENPGAYIAEAVGGADWEYTDCRPYDQDIHMGGMFELTAKRADWESEQSDVALFNSEAIGGPARPHKAYWHWEWKPCPNSGNHNPWLGQYYRSRYTNSIGSWVFGYTSFDKDSGLYQLDSGEIGTLHNLEFAHDYSWVRGLWTFQNGVQGWFKFHKTEEGFDGVYGYGSDHSQPSAGKWKGYLE